MEKESIWNDMRDQVDDADNVGTIEGINPFNFDDTLTMEDFESLLEEPITKAYRIPSFLSESQKKMWYKELRYLGYRKLEKGVLRYVHNNSKLPVLADIVRECRIPD